MFKRNLTSIKSYLFQNKPVKDITKIAGYHSQSLQNTLRHGVHELKEDKNSIEIPTVFTNNINNKYNSSITKRMTDFVASGQTETSPK